MIKLHTRLLCLLLIVIVLTVTLIPAAAQSERGSSYSYMPVVTKPINCAIGGQTYRSLPIIPPPTPLPAVINPDMNLGLRGYARTDAALRLVNLAPVTDPKAPQLSGLFTDNRVPTFSAAYQRYRWDWNCNCPTDTYSPWDTTVLGMRVAPGEVIRVPNSGYDVGGGNDVYVLYADSRRITLHYGATDDLAGYAVHIEDVCVEPRLLALYQSLNAAGRRELPVLPGHQPLGRAIGREIKVAIRDTGHFLDPRSRNDWWQGR